MTLNKTKLAKDIRLDRHSANPKSSAYGDKSGVKGGSGLYNWGNETKDNEEILERREVDSQDPIYDSDEETKKERTAKHIKGTNIN
ncbi:uncharacterized protein CMU_026890 [Cryptosporidium muris RN66]|uniref:Hyaluronan/mRNA-binding protein domain-containing protein n=1 Tax=Cryptosporidium muris (strain RN66) TaxID=441375 RepID=B6ABC9_CRYMR|nr:uncharacterized protein CMU_026890 [Cryptosporidium muris RN66]EEA05681.1 hypothetical protein, conserved [Cryptosporidium muris RN66]|eukprot:XP_002140030.1 hypothetical protein [Cryptosporidium muris RN66]